MQDQDRNKRNPRSVLLMLATGVLAVGLTVEPLSAQGFGIGRGVAVGENGAAARSRGVVSNGNGFAARRGGAVADGQGNGFARQGGCVSGQSADGCRGRAATWGADGSFSGQSASEFNGENGALSGRRSLTRDADGNLTGNRSVDASGTDGAYSGASTLDDGTYNRDGTYTATDGQSATVDSTFARGSGGSRSVTCIDASGAVVSCP